MDEQLSAIKEAMQAIWDASNKLMQVGIDTLTQEDLNKDFISNHALDAQTMLDDLYFALADKFAE